MSIKPGLCRGVLPSAQSKFQSDILMIRNAGQLIQSFGSRDKLTEPTAEIIVNMNLQLEMTVLQELELSKTTVRRLVNTKIISKVLILLMTEKNF